MGDYKRGKEILKFVIVLVIFLAVLAVVYYLFFYAETCPDQECFSKAIVKCDRARWLNDAEEATWFYTIKGSSGGNCEIEVKLLNIKKGKTDIGKAEGKSMLCYTPLGVMTSPGKDLASCTGQLKEELQDLIIKKMHSYILENLGKINEELTKAI